MKKELLRQRHPERYAVYKQLINNYAWQRLRNKKIQTQPLCEDCLAKGRVMVAEEVHHNTPVEHGRTYAEMRALAYDFSNLVSLCKACHHLRHNPQTAENKQDNDFTRFFFGKK